MHIGYAPGACLRGHLGAGKIISPTWRVMAHATTSQIGTGCLTVSQLSSIEAVGTVQQPVMGEIGGNRALGLFPPANQASQSASAAASMAVEHLLRRFT
jgi:hypothetical protein